MAPKRLMPPQDRAVIAAVIKALAVPRDRLGRLDPSGALGRYVGSDSNLTAHGLRLGIPNGGLDRIDKAVMVLQALIGRKPVSILDKQ